MFLQLKIKILQSKQTMITKDKVIEIFCIIDEFDKNLNDELSKNLRLTTLLN